MSDLSTAIATYGLTGRTTELAPHPLDDDEWQRLRVQVAAEKLSGLLLAAVVAGDLPVTDAQYEQACHWHEGALTTALLLDRRMVQVVPQLTAAGLDVLVLKGASVAQLDHPDPGLRLYGDVDILLRSEQFDAGVVRLAELGYERPWTEMRPGFDARFGKGATLRDADGYELDVHRTFVFGAFGLAIELDDLFAAPAAFQVGGERLLALGDAERFLHACYHAALGASEPRLVQLRDIVQLLPQDPAIADRVLELTARWQGEAVVGRALTAVERVFGLRLEGVVADRLRDHEPTRRQARAVGSYVGSDRGFAAQVLAALPYLDGMRDRAAFLRAALAPTADSITSRGRDGRLAWLRRGVDALRTRLRP